MNNKSFNYKAMQFIPDIQNPKTNDAVNYRTDRDNVYNKNKYYDKQTKSKSKNSYMKKLQFHKMSRILLFQLWLIVL